MPLSGLIREGMRKRALYSFSLLFASFLSIWTFLTFESVPGHCELNSWLLERLVSIKPLPEDFNERYPNSKNIIYVLGGSQSSLIYRFKTAAGLYRNSGARKILTLSRPGITEYDPVLGRNLTNDEWTVNQLVAVGVKKEDIETVSFEEGILGTATEAKGISDLAVKGDYKHILLVTSLYHTARTRMTVAKFLNDRDTSLFVYASNDHTELQNLLYEYFKFVIYEYFVL
ncbi:MAG: YdcF family protein [Nitrososphaera sp.]|nr:YdcF family protein [Nitrososphaera sp.]